MPSGPRKGKTTKSLERYRGNKHIEFICHAKGILFKSQYG